MKNHEKIMSHRETNPLAELEETIARGKKRILEMGLALGEIRDLRLYRRDYGSFEEYCRAKWGCGRQQVYRLIKAASRGQGPRVVTSEQNKQLN